VGNEKESEPGSVLDKEAGLLLSSGNEVFYSQLLKEFYRAHGGDLCKIKTALSEGDRKTACRLAHTLKSSSAFIGAAALTGAAFRAEKALDPGHREAAESCDGIISELEAAFAALVKELGRLLPGKEKGAAGTRADKDKILALIRVLEPLLAHNDCTIFEYRNEIDEVFAPLGEDGEEFVSRIDEFEFEKAAEILQKIRGSLFLEP